MKNDLLSELQKAREQLLLIINKLPEDKILVGKWTKKEILAHIVGWEEETVISIPQILSGEKPRSFRISMNKFNEENVSKRKSKNIGELLNELTILRKKVIEQITDLSEEQFKNYYGTKLGKKQINVLWIINELISHDKNHTKELEKKII